MGHKTTVRIFLNAFSDPHLYRVHDKGKKLKLIMNPNTLSIAEKASGKRSLRAGGLKGSGLPRGLS